MDADAAKEAAGKAVADIVEDGQCVGLGSGSTAAYAIAALGRRIRDEGLQVIGAATSSSAERLARLHGVPLGSLSDLRTLDLAFDGADEVDPALNLIKGRGAAHTREKVIAGAASRFVVLVDDSKLVRMLGTRMPVPVEVLPMAEYGVMKALEQMGAQPELRIGLRKDGPVVTDQGFWVIDARFSAIVDPALVDREILQIPGVLDHGLFIGLATEVLVGVAGQGVRRLTRQETGARP